MRLRWIPGRHSNGMQTLFYLYPGRLEPEALGTFGTPGHKEAQGFAVQALVAKDDAHGARLSAPIALWLRGATDDRNERRGYKPSVPTGDGVFDTHVYVASDAPDAEVQALLANDELRWHIAALLMIRAPNSIITISANGTVSVAYNPGIVPAAEEIRPLLDSLLKVLPPFVETPVPKPAGVKIATLLMCVAVILPIITLHAFIEPMNTLSPSFAPLAIGGSLLFAMLTFMIGRSGDFKKALGPQLVTGRIGRTYLVWQVVSSAIFNVNGLGITRGPETLHDVLRIEKRGVKDVAVVRDWRDGREGTLSIELPSHARSAAQPNSKLRLYVHAGRLGGDSVSAGSFVSEE